MQRDVIDLFVMRVGIPAVLFEGPYVSSTEVNDGLFDVSPDGQRFLMIREGGSSGETADQLTVTIVQTWFEELTRLVPVN